jgi:hypothetical protein
MARKQGHGKQAASRPSDGRGPKGRESKWPVASPKTVRGAASRKPSKGSEPAQGEAGGKRPAGPPDAPGRKD